MAHSSANPSNRPSCGVSEHARADGVRELVLLKQGQRYVFTCAPGEEAALLHRLREMARDTENNLDWYDAALLADQVGVRLGERLQSYSSHTKTNG